MDEDTVALWARVQSVVMDWCMRTPGVCCPAFSAAVRLVSHGWRDEHDQRVTLLRPGSWPVDTRRHFPNVRELVFDKLSAQHVPEPVRNPWLPTPRPAQGVYPCMKGDTSNTTRAYGHTWLNSARARSTQTTLYNPTSLSGS
jgi:hypothetical protein